MHSIYVDFRCDYFGIENRTNFAVKIEHIQNICDITDEVNLQNRSKIAGCSHMQIFRAIEIAEKLHLKSQ